MNPDTAELAIPAAPPVARSQPAAWPQPPARSLPGAWRLRSRRSAPWPGDRWAAAHDAGNAAELGAKDAERRTAVAHALRALVGSRLVVWAVGSGSVLLLGFGPPRKALSYTKLARGLGPVGNVLAAPAARWDAGWYLLIARAGYAPALGSETRARDAFFPLYPLVVRLGSVVFTPVLAGVLASMLALALALYGLHRLTALEVRSGWLRFGPGLAPSALAGSAGAAPANGAATPGGAAPAARVTGGSVPAKQLEDGSGVRVARLAVLVLAFSPMAFFLSAVYSESLYLAFSVGVFWFARNGRFRWVGALGALAAATRPTGVLLMLPAALLYLYGPREDRPPDRPRPAVSLAGVLAGRRPGRHSSLGERLGALLRPRYRVGRDVLWLALMPAGALVFMSYLAAAGGDFTAPLSAQQLWGRELAGPFVGLWDGAVAAFDGVRQLASLQGAHAYFARSSGDALVAASHDVPLFAFAVAGLVAVAGVLRRLPLAYGAYALLALALALSYPVAREPLMSLPRFLLVLFPLAMWLGGYLDAHPRARLPLLAGSALLMAFFTGAFATWHWVA